VLGFLFESNVLNGPDLLPGISISPAKELLELGQVGERLAPRLFVLACCTSVVFRAVAGDAYPGGFIRQECGRSCIACARKPTGLTPPAVSVKGILRSRLRSWMQFNDLGIEKLSSDHSARLGLWSARVVSIQGGIAIARRACDGPWALRIDICVGRV